MKTCTRCLLEKSLDSFYRRKGYRDGVQSTCKACEALKSKEWASRNKELVAERAAAWRAANPEKAREVNIASLRKRRAANLEEYRARERDGSRNRDKAQRKIVNQTYYVKNKETIALRNKLYSENNPSSRVARRAKRRALEFCSQVKWANQFFISEAYHLAKLREKATGIKWHVDHIVPLNSKIVCGLHVEVNLQVIPAFINQSKSNAYWPDMPSTKSILL